jgi:adenosylhomocysteine nucleosidase
MQLLHSGVGKINAALTACDAIARFKPRLIVNYGTAGALQSGASGLIEIGSVIQRDMNAEPLAPRGVTPFSDSSAEIHSGHAGLRCATGDSFVTAADEWLVHQRADVVDMELYAIAHVCRRSGVPWRAFKFVTDAADDSAADHWNERVGHGEEQFVAALESLAVVRP